MSIIEGDDYEFVRNAGPLRVTDLSSDVYAKAKHLLDKLKDVDLPQPTGFHVLVLQWIRREKVGSIYLSDKSHAEDKWQGRSGLVLALGPDAYEGSRYPSGPWCQPGDWVAWPAMANAASRIEFANVVLAILPDDKICLVGCDPELVT